MWLGMEKKMTVVSVVALCCWLTIPTGVAMVSQKMANITFECPDPFMIDGPGCYLLVDVAMTHENARDMCKVYGANLVEIRDEEEAKAVGKMVQNRYSDWDLYWIGNVLQNETQACAGFWDRGEPKDVAVTSPIFVAANAPRGKWKGHSKDTRLPFICYTDACVEGTFRCRNGEKCLNNNWKCDGIYDCEDQSDESDCAANCTYYYTQSTGTLTENSGYSPGKTCTWVIEGPPGQPLSIEFTSLDVEEDLDYVEVWSGSPSVLTSDLQVRLTGSLLNRTVYGCNNFLIVRLVSDLTVQKSGFVATWKVDDELSQRERAMTATDSWTELTSPHYGRSQLPTSYVRHYAVSVEKGSVITMEVLENGLGNHFEYDPETLSSINGEDTFPATYVSLSNTFSFYLVSDDCDGDPEKFKARVKKGCVVDISRANGYILPPNFNYSSYPASLTCSYTIRAPQDAPRGFQLGLPTSNLADAKDTVKVFNGSDSSGAELTPSGGYTGSSPAPTTTFTSGDTVFVEFTSSLVQTDGFFKLVFNLGCPDITNTANMMLSTQDTQFGSEVTLSCQTGFAFSQEEFTNSGVITIQCDLGGKWNTSRLPTCSRIYCGVPQSIDNGFIAAGSGGAQYDATVEYQCYAGFAMRGSNVSTCGNGSIWSARPSCDASQCSSPAAMANGNFSLVTGNGTSFGSIVNYTCDPGFDMIGSQYTLCGTSGWSHPSPVCERIKCPIPDIDRAQLSTSDPLVFEGTLTVTCDAGFVHVGTNDSAKSYSCMASGDFGVDQDVCVDFDECAAGTHGCNNPHQTCLNTVGSAVCGCEDQYKKTGFSCVVIDRCSEGTTGCDSVNGLCQATNSGEDYICLCNTGYTLFTANGTSGRYIPYPETGTTPGDVHYINHTCVPETCAPPPNITDGEILTRKTMFDYGDTVEYRCNFGFRLTTTAGSNNILTCGDNGTWDMSPPTCQAMTCGALEATGLVRNIFPNATTSPDDIVLLECYSQSEEKSYNKTLYCAYDDASGDFTLQGNAPNCPAIDCGALTPVGGAIFTLPADRGLGSTFNFSCSPGFDLQGISAMGNEVVTCEKNGRWGLGNLTCSGTRCTDPGTPGGMTQLEASFEVGGMVVYNCTREGFRANPPYITCQYNVTSDTAHWDSSTPVCEDIQVPMFTNCPTDTIKLALYGNPLTGIGTPTATDNSGLVIMSVSPVWFHSSLALSTKGLNVTYTASDSLGSGANQAQCELIIEVNDPGVLPTLTCPDYLVLDVNTTSNYTVSLADYIITDGDCTLSFSEGPSVTVGPATVGHNAYRVTTTNMFGFQRQCAFIVDIKPNACLQTYIERDISSKNAAVTCAHGGNGMLNCTVTCSSNFVFQDGSTSMSYDCHGANSWTPALPLRSCVGYVDAKYTYVVEARYSFSDFQIHKCQSGLTSSLQEHVPTEVVPTCVYNTGSDSLKFSVEAVEYKNIELQEMNAIISLAVTSDPNAVTSSDYTACALRIADIGFARPLFAVPAVPCSTFSTNRSLTVESLNLVTNSLSCPAGRALVKVANVDKCVQCEPGFYFNGSTCMECEDGKYQNEAGMTECKTCGGGATYTIQPRISSGQCVASCPGGFNNSQSQVASPAQCLACPEDTYLNTDYSPSCIACSDGKTTWGVEGAVSPDQCIDLCSAGQYPVNNTHCAPCPRGYFKANVSNEACTPCTEDQTTVNPGSVSSSDCSFIVNDCPSDSGGAYYHRLYCGCEEGYYGENCTDKINACDSSPCYNGGTCSSDNPNDFRCECPSEPVCSMVPNDIPYNSSKEYLEILQGTTLESCKQKCLDNAECAVFLMYTNSNYCLLYNATEYTNGSNSPHQESFLKSCSRTYFFGGARCEVDLRNNCTNDTCADRSFCRDLLQDADCVCPSDGKYKGPKCETNLDVCSPDPCQNNAKCIDSGNGVRSTCECLPGFTGDLCETNIDDCAINPGGCLYGRNCIDGVNTYRCDCGVYGGQLCQVRPNFCSTPGICNNGLCYNNYTNSSAVCVCDFPYELGSGKECVEIDVCVKNNPCDNNGTCRRVGVGETTCDCPPGYTGTHCQHDINDCASSPCVNGTCTDLLNNYTCQCHAGFDGYNCDNNIDDCANANCTVGNFDRCQDLVNDYMCICKVGFTGKVCEVDIDECMSMPCQHNGSCSQSSTPGQYTCTCEDGWTGENCEDLPQYCNDSTCENAGICFSLQDNFFCDCKSGTFGDTCQQASNLCDVLNPCTSANMCRGGNGTAVCDCPDNYTGGSCHLLEDSCSDSPCQNRGTCIPLAMGYVCQCDEGYSGATCGTAASVCDSVVCPHSATCLAGVDQAMCQCGVKQLKSGLTCKEISNDFDMYFTKAEDAIRSAQPLVLTSNSLSITFWLAPLKDSEQPCVELRLSNGTVLLAFDKDNVIFGSESPTQLIDNISNTGNKTFDKNTWNQITVTWNSTGHYHIYFSGTQLQEGMTSAAFPPLNRPIYLYIGGEYVGYISQLFMWQRILNFSDSLTMYGNPKTPLPQDLLFHWSSYRLYDNLWSKLIYPSFVQGTGQVCSNGRWGSACTDTEPDKMPPAVTGCPTEPVSSNVPRLVQITNFFPNELFKDGQSVLQFIPNIERTVLTFGAHRLVLMAYDEEENAAFCRFTAYVKSPGQVCSQTQGLSNIQSCMSQGQTVQCPSNGRAPLSPNILTCGKLGSYNFDDPYHQPPAVVCGAVQEQKYKVTVDMEYQISSVDCDGNVEVSANSALEQKVKDLNGDWTTLCPDSNCNNAQLSVKCKSSASRVFQVSLVLTAVPATLTHRATGVTLTARELLQTATLELDVFSIGNVFGAQLQSNTVVIVAVPNCDAGFGLADDICVECTQGSYLNETTGRCELCPIGSYTDTDRQTACTTCSLGFTTDQLGANRCSVSCPSGQYRDLSIDSCKDCAKNFYQNMTGQVSCVPCPAGKATESNGTDSADLCYDTCDAGTELKNSTCVPCPRGYYRDGINQEKCEQCPAGNTTEGEGSTSLNRCYQTACQPGNARNSTTNLCESCGYGSYQPDQWQDLCLSCNDSYTTENMGSTTADQCIFVCPAGEENLQGTECTACKVGFYRTDSIADRFLNCTQCNSTFTTASTASKLESDCNIRICNAGYYRNETDNLCYECPFGRYQPDSLQTECLPCSGNKTTRQMATVNATQCVFFCAAGYEVLSAQNETCQACQRGKYKTGNGNDRFDPCQSCNASTTTENEASVSDAFCNIPICTAGQIISPAGICQDCDKDLFQPETLPRNITECQACPTGTGTMEGKQTSETDCSPVCGAGEQFNVSTVSCQPCPLGTWNTGNHTQRFAQCSPCPQGLVTVGEMEGARSILNCTLRDCPAGQFINASDECELCPIGQYQDVPRQTSCKNCRTDTNTSREGSRAESDCTISCPAGKEEAQGGVEDCTLCQADYYKDYEGPGNCMPCTGNYTSDSDRRDCTILYCDKGYEFAAATNSCVACEVGKYKDSRGNTAVCTDCRTNTTTVAQASMSDGDCTKAHCALGFFSPDDQLPCQPCPQGSYKNFTGNANCTLCSADFTTQDIASTQPDQCSVVVCPLGQYRDNSKNVCINCSIGTFQNETGQTYCYNCPTGYLTIAVGSDSLTACKIDCPPGQYRDDALNVCKNCSVGSYQPSTGQTGCVPCDPDYTTANEASTTTTDCFIVCRAGRFSTSRTSCQPCAKGQYQSANGSSSCDSCSAGNTTLDTGSTSQQECYPICDKGKYLNVATKTCDVCPLGSYNPDTGNITMGNTTCQPCPVDYTTNATGATDVAQCNILDCKPGSFRSTNVGCQKCPLGQYQPVKGQDSCLACPALTTTLVTGRISNDSCVDECPGGKEYNIVTKMCDNCTVGFYRSTTVGCIRCPSGKTTLGVGADRCIDAVGVTPAPRQQRTIRLTLVLRIRLCENRQQMGNVIITMIENVMLRTDTRFPAICRNRCENMDIVFEAGCLRNYVRGKRQAGESSQTVAVELSGVPNEVEENQTGNIYEALPEVVNAFYDIQEEQATLQLNKIAFEGVTNSSSIAQCQPGQYTKGAECDDCAAGSYSTDGSVTSCTLCEQNSYQSNTKQSSCTPCPSKTYTSATGSTQESSCVKKCDEPNSGQKYCSGHGICMFDATTSNGVRCQCSDNYGGATCLSRITKSDDKTTMIGAIAGGVGAFLLLVLIIIGVVVCLRRAVDKGKKGDPDRNGSRDTRYLTRPDDGSSELYMDYNYPFHESTIMGYPNKPAIMYMNPAADQDVRDFYTQDRSTRPSSRQRSQSYESEWKEFDGIM